MFYVLCVQEERLAKCQMGICEGCVWVDHANGEGGLLLHDADAPISLIHICVCLAVFNTLLSLDSFPNVYDCANIL